MKTVLVTGASSGIGFKFAEAFVKRGCYLFLVSRDSKRLTKAVQELKKYSISTITAISIDLSKRGSAEKLFEMINKTYKRRVDILINNAGIGNFGELLHLTNNKVEELLNLNIHSLSKLTYLFAKDMKQGGTVINVASVVGYVPMSYAALYSASKAYVLNFSEALIEEFKPRNIRVISLCPGTTRTSFFERAGVTSDALKMEKPSGIFRFNFAMEPQEVVKELLRAMDGNRDVVITGWANKLMVWLTTRILPRSFSRRMAARFAKKRV